MPQFYRIYDRNFIAILFALIILLVQNRVFSTTNRLDKNSHLLSKSQANSYLAKSRSKRSNGDFFEEFSAGNFERECIEEVCSAEELNEVAKVEYNSKEYNPGKNKTLEQIHDERQDQLIKQCALYKPCNSNNSKSCVNSWNAYTCECKKFWYGKHCEFNKCSNSTYFAEQPAIYQKDKNECVSCEELLLVNLNIEQGSVSQQFLEEKIFSKLSITSNNQSDSCFYEDIDECQQNNNICGQYSICQNINFSDIVSEAVDTKDTSKIFNAESDNGYICQDIDECGFKKCPKNTKCVNQINQPATCEDYCQVGQHTCDLPKQKCIPDFENEPGYSCEDVDLCKEGTDDFPCIFGLQECVQFVSEDGKQLRFRCEDIVVVETTEAVRPTTTTEATITTQSTTSTITTTQKPTTKPIETTTILKIIDPCDSNPCADDEICISSINDYPPHNQPRKKRQNYYDSYPYNYDLDSDEDEAGSTQYTILEQNFEQDRAELEDIFYNENIEIDETDMDPAEFMDLDDMGLPYICVPKTPAVVGTTPAILETTTEPSSETTTIKPKPKDQNQLAEKLCLNKNQDPYNQYCHNNCQPDPCSFIYHCYFSQIIEVECSVECNFAIENYEKGDCDQYSDSDSENYRGFFYYYPVGEDKCLFENEPYEMYQDMMANGTVTSCDELNDNNWANAYGIRLP